MPLVDYGWSCPHQVLDGFSDLRHRYTMLAPDGSENVELNEVKEREQCGPGGGILGKLNE